MSEENENATVETDGMTAWDVTSMERKGLANLTEEELGKYIAWKADLKAQQLYIEKMQERAEDAQRKLEETEAANLESAQSAFEGKVTEIMEKIQARLGGE